MSRKVLWGVVGALCAAGLGQGTLTPRLSLEEMVERSERIVRGRCLRTWAAWDADRQFIWTHAEIQVADWLKGGREATLVVSEPGGVVGGLSMTIDGAPQYQPGEEVVAFLYRTPIGFWRLRGLGQGKFRIQADAAGRRLARPDLAGVALVDSNGRPARQAAFDGLGLEEFLHRVRGLVARQAAGGGR